MRKGSTRDAWQRMMAARANRRRVLQAGAVASFASAGGLNGLLAHDEHGIAGSEVEGGGTGTRAPRATVPVRDGVSIASGREWTDQDIRNLMSSLSNWGRWGPNDQLGALNYITPQKRVAAAAEIRDGQVVSLSLPLDTTPSVDNARPVTHLFTGTGERGGVTSSGDYIAMQYHGRTISHIDAFCHFFFDNKMYNGFSSNEVRPDGAFKGAIHEVRDRIVGRGVLLDIPRLLGRDFLEAGETIFLEDWLAAEQREGVTVGEGDILLVRTGRWKRNRLIGRNPAELAGNHFSVAPFLRERRVAILGSDGWSDVNPSGHTPRLPVHNLTLVAMGIHLLDNQDLEALSEACAQRNRYSFFFMLAPLYLARGTGSPANALAVF